MLPFESCKMHLCVNDRASAWVSQVGIQAYLMWEKAGQPDGADFSNDARKALQEQMEKGATIEHLEKSLKAPSPKEPEPVPVPQQTQEEPQARKAPPRGQSKMPKQDETEVIGII